jgi:hypothetical protein
MTSLREADLPVRPEPWVESHGYQRPVAPRRGPGRSVARRGGATLFLCAFLACFLLVLPAFAQPVTVLDRIGTNSLTTDHNPGGMSVHYAHGTATEIWGTSGTVWTQPFNGTLAEAAFVSFARVVNATNGMLLDPVTNLSTFPMSVHVWTNGAATNVIIRQSFASTAGTPDRLATYAGPGSLKAGPLLTNWRLITNLHRERYFRLKLPVQ